jgi:hypothetical protein
MIAGLEQGIIREQLDLEDWMLEKREEVAAHIAAGHEFQKLDSSFDLRLCASRWKHQQRHDKSHNYSQSNLEKSSNRGLGGPVVDFNQNDDGESDGRESSCFIKRQRAASKDTKSHG